MAFYLVQASYTPQAVAAMIKKPQDRAAAVKPLIEQAGGKLAGLWFAFGTYDIVAIAEMPDNVSAASFAMAVGSSGAFSAYHTTPLLTTAEAVKAMYPYYMVRLAGGALFFNYGIAHCTKGNTTERDRAGLALHFLKSSYREVARAAMKVRSTLSGPNYTGGRAEWGETIEGVWESL